MFLELGDFARDLLSRSPSVALVTWASEAALRSFLARLGPSLRAECPGTVLTRLCSDDLDSASFQEQLLARLNRRDASKRCLLVYRVEPLASAAATILNGFRERLASLKAVVVAIRDNRKRDFVLECPDLMDWVGPSVVRAEDLGPPMTLHEVNAAIREYEQRFGISSKELQTRWSQGQVEATDDYWLWNELLALRAALKRAGNSRR